jgi:hypothetical protein
MSHDKKIKIKEDAPTMGMGGGTSVQGTGPIAFADPPLDNEKKKKKPRKRLREVVQWPKKT